MSLLIQKAGVFTSVQNLGRFGLQRFGINPRGAMDRTAARIINLLLGNDDNAAVLEFYFPAPEIVFEEASQFALGGADFTAELDGNAITNWRTYGAAKSSVLRFGKKVFGSRCYLGLIGGIAASGSEQSGFVTHRLQKGDRLCVDESISETARTVRNRSVSKNIFPPYSSFPTVRITTGGEFAKLIDTDKNSLESANFVISNDSNRMGFRLRGPDLHLTESTEIVSAAVNFGTVQLLPDGQLIVLMADHQTSGGYPRVAHVISADLPLLAQLGPGDKFAFKVVELREAEHLAAQVEADLQKLKIGVSFGRYW